MSEPIQPKRFERGSKTHTHDLYKLSVSKMKTNLSYKAKEPILVEREHTHHFHSINDTTLQPNKYCSPVGGHFHEKIGEGVREDGTPFVKFGPALEYRHRKVANNRTTRQAVPVQFESYPTEAEMNSPSYNGAAVIFIKDDHVHEVEYLGSEEFTAKGRQQYVKENKDKIAGLSSGPVATQAAKVAAMTTGPAAEAAKAHLSEATGERPAGQE